MSLKKGSCTKRARRRYISEPFIVLGFFFPVVVTSSIFHRSLIPVSMATGNRQRVVLHFDINRTILMSDAAGGRSMENTVNYLLSECTWGYASRSTSPSNWICVSTVPSHDLPVTINSADTSPERPLITYKQFVDEMYPYVSLASTSDSCHAVDQIEAINKAAKNKRTALQSAFTGTPNAPGHCIQQSFDHVIHQLHFPMGEQRDAAKQMATNMPPSRLQEAWSQGRYYLLPSFLHFLSYLASPKMTQKQLDVKLVFRTFGDDIVEVKRELDILVNGQHPVGMPALPEHFRLNLSPNARCVGTFYRDGFGANGTALAVGTLAKVPFSTKVTEEGATAPDNFYAMSDEKVEVIRGFQPIQETLEGMFHKANTLALRDYWEWWSAHAEDNQYGKLLLIDEEKLERDGDVVVFFDDHIEAHHAHIVDVRDVRSGDPMDFGKSRAKYLQRVEPIEAITNPNYFITLFETHVAKVK